MLSTSFPEALATTGFAGRATFMPDGRVVYRLRDKSGSVILPRAEWDRLEREFADRLALVRKRTRWLSVGLFPAIFLYAMTLAQVLPFGGPIILAGVFLGPLIIYLAHSHQVRAIAASIEARLAGHGRTAPVEPDRRRTPRPLEIALLVLAGPHLLVAVIGQIGGPDTFRGTPWWGTRIGPIEIIIFGLIAMKLCWPKLGPWLARMRG